VQTTRGETLLLSPLERSRTVAFERAYGDPEQAPSLGEPGFEPYMGFVVPKVADSKRSPDRKPAPFGLQFCTVLACMSFYETA
jgi:hypothetical protein